MKYSIHDLVVIRGNVKDDEHYFVCKLDSWKSPYREILTGKEVKANLDSIPRGLNLYYENMDISKISKHEIMKDYPKIEAYYRKKYRNRNLDGKHYVMEDKYEAKQLMVAYLYLNLETISDLGIHMGCEYDFSDERFIFKLIEDGKFPKLQEIFTGFITNDFGEFSAVQVTPLIKVVPRLEGQILSKMDLLLLQNEINHPIVGDDSDDKIRAKTKEKF